MNRYEALMERIRNGERILIDGATGTEIELRGVPQLDNAWNGGGALSHPDIVREVHEDYLRAGAEIVISNTFATHRHALRDAGVDAQFEAYNRRGVELAIEARERSEKPNVLVAGGISYWSWTGDHPPLDELGESATEQARIMADAGADLLMLEMMIDIDKMLTVLDAATTTGLPVWAGLTCKPDADGQMCLRNGDPLTDALTELNVRNVALINFMHTDVAYIDGCLDAAEGHWTNTIGVYAHTGGFVDNKWVFDGMISPADYASASRRWLDRGVQVIGGCCGIRVDHIARLRDIV